MGQTPILTNQKRKKYWNEKFMLLVQLVTKSDLKQQYFSFQIKHKIIIT